MLSIEEIENSIDYKYNKFYNSDTYELTIEEAKYILLEGKGFCDAVNYAAVKTLLYKIEQLETKEQKLIEKLEEEHTKAKTEFSNTLSPYKYGRLDVIENILEILKGE